MFRSSVLPLVMSQNARSSSSSPPRPAATATSAFTRASVHCGAEQGLSDRIKLQKRMTQELQPEWKDSRGCSRQHLRAGLIRETVIAIP